jgi:glutathione peroxidase
MNAVHATPQFNVVAIPCNQFGLQEPAPNKTELLNGLQYVRPGGGYKPEFHISARIDVNGLNEHRLYKQIKQCCVPTYKKQIGDPKKLFYDFPIHYNDVQWNFEKFLIDPSGIPRKRYDPHVTPLDVANDAKTLMRQ